MSLLSLAAIGLGVYDGRKASPRNGQFFTPDGSPTVWDFGPIRPEPKRYLPGRLDSDHLITDDDIQKTEPTWQIPGLDQKMCHQASSQSLQDITSLANTAKFMRQQLRANANPLEAPVHDESFTEMAYLSVRDFYGLDVDPDVKNLARDCEAQLEADGASRTSEEEFIVCLTLIDRSLPNAREELAYEVRKFPQKWYWTALEGSSYCRGEGPKEFFDLQGHKTATLNPVPMDIDRGVQLFKDTERINPNVATIHYMLWGLLANKNHEASALKELALFEKLGRPVDDYLYEWQRDRYGTGHPIP